MSESLEDSKRFITKTVTLKPGAMRSIAAGAYQSGDPDPTFTSDIEPNTETDTVVVKQERLDIPGKQRYTVLFQLHNYGHKDCTVTITRMEAPKETKS